MRRKHCFQKIKHKGHIAVNSETGVLLFWEAVQSSIQRKMATSFSTQEKEATEFTSSRDGRDLIQGSEDSATA